MGKLTDETALLKLSVAIGQLQTIVDLRCEDLSDDMRREMDLVRQAIRELRTDLGHVSDGKPTATGVQELPGGGARIILSPLVRKIVFGFFVSGIGVVGGWMAHVIWPATRRWLFGF